MWASVGPLPQTSQAAEHDGLIAAGAVLVTPTHAWGDCITVVKEHALAWMARLSPRRRYAGVWRSLLQTKHPSFMTKASWTKGHAWDRSTPEQGKAMTSQEKWQALGNRAVDLKADAGREAHPRAARHGSIR